MIAAVEAHQQQDAQEIFRAVPGVTAHAPGSVGVSYRGFGSGSLGQLFNGITVQYSIAARPVDSWIYDRVEAIGGAVEFPVRLGRGGRVHQLHHQNARAHRLHRSAGACSWRRLREVSIGINRRLGSAAAAAGGGTGSRAADMNRRQQQLNEEGTERAAPRSWRHRCCLTWAAARATCWPTNTRTKTCTARIGAPPCCNRPWAGSALTPGTRDKNYNSADGLYAQRVQWLRSVAQWRVSDALQLRNTLYAYDALRDYRNVETYAFNATNTAVARWACCCNGMTTR